MTYELLIERIKSGQNFSFSRWGDGEFLCIKSAFEGTERKFNTDGHLYFKDLGQELALVLSKYNKHSDYFQALQSMATRDLPEVVEKYFYPFVDYPYVDSDMLHKSSIYGTFSEFLNALKGRDRIILVGPDRLKALDKYFKFTHVVIPDSNCWESFDSVLKKLRLASPNSLVIYSASMMSNVLIDRMWDRFGNTITQIDCGSVFEPYIGHSNRRYHKQIIDKLCEK